MSENKKGGQIITIRDSQGRVLKRFVFTEEEWFNCDKEKLAQQLKQEIQQLPPNKMTRH